MTAVGTKVTAGRRGAARVAVKRYPAADTARYKCWGAGARNEEVARALLGPCVPDLLAGWHDGGTECVALEWVNADPLLRGQPAEPTLVAAGRLLGRMHSQVGPHWGSLDGAHVFADCRHALASRLDAATGLLTARDPELADAYRRWVRDRLHALPADAGPPVLVHGDFGPSNILADGDRLWVVDWEHARWGHPLEDWAKIWLAARFPEPNGFAASAVTALGCGWSAETGRDVPADGPLSEVVQVYLAACLGVFFGERDGCRGRLDWVREVVTG